MCISMWSHRISPDHGLRWLMTEAKVLQSQPGDVQGMVKCIWMICAAPRELSRKAGTAKEAARGNRLSLPSQKHWNSLLYYSHIVDKNQGRSTNALREKLSGNLFYLCEQKQTSLITYRLPTHWTPALASLLWAELLLSWSAYGNIFLPSSQTSRGTNNCYCSFCLKWVHLGLKSKSEWTERTE